MFKVITNQDDLTKVFIIRGIVFIEEQGVLYKIERDAYDYLQYISWEKTTGNPLQPSVYAYMVSMRYWNALQYGNHVFSHLNPHFLYLHLIMVNNIFTFFQYRQFICISDLSHYEL